MTDLRAVCFEDADVLLRRLWINHADKPQTQQCAGLCQSDTHVSRARFDHNCSRGDLAKVKPITKDAERRAIFNAAAGVEHFKFGEQLEVAILEDIRKPDKRGLAD